MTRDVDRAYLGIGGSDPIGGRYVFVEANPHHQPRNRGSVKNVVTAAVVTIAALGCGKVFAGDYINQQCISYGQAWCATGPLAGFLQTPPGEVVSNATVQKNGQVVRGLGSYSLSAKGIYLSKDGRQIAIVPDFTYEPDVLRQAFGSQYKEKPTDKTSKPLTDEVIKSWGLNNHIGLLMTGLVSGAYTKEQVCIQDMQSIVRAAQLHAGALLKTPVNGVSSSLLVGAQNQYDRYEQLGSRAATDTQNIVSIVVASASPAADGKSLNLTPVTCGVDLYGNVAATSPAPTNTG